MAVISSLPYNLTNGTTADASQVMANFNQIYNNVNSNAATAGANTNITSLLNLTTALSTAQGGTGSLSPTANCVAVGEGTSPMNFVGPGTAGQVLTSNGAGSDPSFQAFNAVPSGAMMMWGTATVPAGWLEANGQSTAGYPNLIAIYGATLPDMRGVFPRGWDHGRGLDPNAPTLLEYVVDEFKSHTHALTDPGHQHTDGADSVVGLAGAANPFRVGNSAGSSVTQVATTGITIASAGGTETAPKYVAWMFIIKT